MFVANNDGLRFKITKEEFELFFELKILSLYWIESVTVINEKGNISEIPRKESLDCYFQALESARKERDYRKAEEAKIEEEFQKRMEEIDKEYRERIKTSQKEILERIKKDFENRRRPEQTFEDFFEQNIFGRFLKEEFDRIIDKTKEIPKRKVREFASVVKKVLFPMSN